MILFLAVSVAVLILFGGLLYRRATAGTNHTTLADVPKNVTMVKTFAQPFQERRRYVGTVEPWVQARIGPQMVSAYVDTVLVRPGATVKRGEIIATLDCRSSSAQNSAIAAQARALDAMRTASAAEAGRVSSLLDGKYVSQNEVDMKNADAASKAAQLSALQAQLQNSALQVNDCVMRAPFDGDVAERSGDPGMFARPGTSIATIVDRHVVRVTADVPEDDFVHVAPDTEVRVHLLATDKEFTAKISRRAPSADLDTRTVHVELDVDDPQREIPTHTTAELSLDIGAPIPATAIPMIAATVHGSKTQVFVVKDGAAHSTRAKLIGERQGVYYVEPSLPAGELVATEGRGLLNDGDKVTGKEELWTPVVAKPKAAP
ncbi:MAG TPA: efflux RND transporter periplasmic adaptor subunit [Kofleriaceae bacterium]|nr:efflux RND transporter periplasmic adaptor subunit [Kofleriaceae bacterium]